MIGHGRPASFAAAHARDALARFAIACAAIVLCACVAQIAAADTPPPTEPTMLRITWGGGEASHWLGRIAIDDGALSDLKILSQEADAGGSIWIDATSCSAHWVSGQRIRSGSR